MVAALIAGERNPSVLAQLARSSMRRKISELEEAFTGHFDDHHRFLLARMLGRIALGERHRRLAKRRGKKHAIVAVGRSILVIIWYLPQDPDAHFHDLGPRPLQPPHQPGHQKHNHIRQLEALGYTVTLTRAA
jgi:hypothetical protein